jgi:hypothetical protein
MTIHLLCSLRGHKRPETRDSILADAMTLLVADYGQALAGMEYRQLDLRVAGRAFRDITGIKGFHVGQKVYARKVIDIWWASKDKTFETGRGYPEWVWQSVYQWLRICGEGGRAWRLMLD